MNKIIELLPPIVVCQGEPKRIILRHLVQITTDSVPYETYGHYLFPITVV